MAFLLSPIANESQINDAGNPLSGGTIDTFLSGTSTRATTYMDGTGDTPQSNPIVLNTIGLAPTIFLDSDLTYKFVIKSSTGIVQRTVDNIVAIGGGAGGAAGNEWVMSGLNPTFINATSFSLGGDQRTNFHVGRRVRAVNTGGMSHSTILTSVFNTLTTITVKNDSTPIDLGVTTLEYGLLSSINPSYTNSAQDFESVMNLVSEGKVISGTDIEVGEDLVNPATVVLEAEDITGLGSAASNNVNIEGGTINDPGNPNNDPRTIRGFGVAPAGLVRWGKFTGFVTLEYNDTSLILPGKLTILTVPGSSYYARSLGEGNWEILFYTNADGLALPVSLATPAEVITGEIETKAPTVLAMRQGLTVHYPAVATTFGSTVEFIDLPSWVNRGHLIFNSLSCDNVAPPIIQVGDEDDYRSSGYLGTTRDTNGGSSQQWTTNVPLYGGGRQQNIIINGMVDFSIHKEGNNRTISISFTLGKSDEAEIEFGGGMVTLTKPLTRIMVTTGREGSFDMGSVSLSVSS